MKGVKSTNAYLYFVSNKFVLMSFGWKVMLPYGPVIKLLFHLVIAIQFSQRSMISKLIVALYIVYFRNILGTFEMSSIIETL